MGIIQLTLIIPNRSNKISWTGYIKVSTKKGENQI